MKPCWNVFANRRAAIILSTALFALVPGALQSTLAQSTKVSLPSGAALLQQLVRAERGVEYSATEVVARPGTPDVVARVWRSGFRRRLEWQSPPVMRGDILVDNGAQVWRYLRSENSAIGTRSSRSEADWEQLSGRFDARVLGTDEQDGRASWQVALSPRGEKRVVRKLWVDRAKGVLLRIEQFDARGQRTKTIALRDVRFAPIAAERFRWSPPSGAQITRMDGTLWTA
ncbi:MAG: Outer rane lipoproteinsorting protein, partial [Abditibacteriota bacterium]|nr:Outer rane lipoproteinsorting protein [Abditibacteriota bacterium]